MAIKKIPNNSQPKKAKLNDSLSVYNDINIKKPPMIFKMVTPVKWLWLFGMDRV